jgi:plasmid stability protein
MGSLTIRRLDDSVKARLRVRAAQHGRSMEEEARQILTIQLAEEPKREENLASSIRRKFAPIGGVDLVIPPRKIWRRRKLFFE